MKYALLKDLTVQPVSKLDMHSLTIILTNGSVLSIHDIINVERKRLIDAYLKVKLNSVITQFVESLSYHTKNKVDFYNLSNLIESYRCIAECKQERLEYQEEFTYFKELFNTLDLLCDSYFLSEKKKVVFMNKWIAYTHLVLERKNSEFSFDYGFNYYFKKNILKRKIKDEKIN